MAVTHTLTGGATTLEIPLGRLFTLEMGLNGVFVHTSPSPESPGDGTAVSGPVHHVDLNDAGASVAITFTGEVDGATYRLAFTLSQDAETHALTWPANVYWSAGGYDLGTAPPALATTGDETEAYLLVTLTYLAARDVWLGRWHAFANG